MSCKQKCKCKCKCKKQPVLLVKYAQDEFEDFYRELNPDARGLYHFESINYKTGLVWVDLVQKKLICMRKKYCRKPHLVSGIFNTDLEMELARISDCFCTLYSSSSTNSTLDLMFIRRKKLIVNISDSGWHIFADNGIYNDYDKVNIQNIYCCEPTGPDYSYSSEIAIMQLKKQIVRREELETLDNVFMPTANRMNLDQIRDQVLTENAVADLVEQGRAVRVGGDDEVEIFDPETGKSAIAKIATNNTTLEAFLKTGGIGVGNDGVLVTRRMVISGSSLNLHLRL